MTLTKSIEKIFGVIVPMFTPFNETGNIDYIGVREVIRYFKSKSEFINGIFPRSGVGKMFTFNYNEVKEIIKITLSESDGIIPILPGTAGEYGNNPQNRPVYSKYLNQTIELTRYAEENGAYAVVIITPTAIEINNPEDAEEIIYNYYREIDSNINIPILIYRPPGIDIKYEITPSLLRKLITLKNVRGMKYSSSKIEKFKEFIEVIGENEFLLICGNETTFFEGLKIGAKGVIGGGCNVYPEIFHYIYENFNIDSSTAQSAQTGVNELIGFKGGYNISFSILSKIYISRKGYNLKVFERQGRRDLPPIEKIEEFEKSVDEKISKYVK